MGEPSAEIDVIFVGQTGVGKSTLINMIMGIPAARTNNDAGPCTTETTSYPTLLETGSQCRLWDTCGLGEATGTSEAGWSFLSTFLNAKRRSRELKETLRDRTKQATSMPILVWCIDAAKVEVSVHWKEFQKVYVEYCQRKAIPAVVITRGPPKASGWLGKCTGQLRGLGLGEDIPVRVVRRYKSPASSEYRDDANVLKGLILELMKRDQ